MASVLKVVYMLSCIYTFSKARYSKYGLSSLPLLSSFFSKKAQKKSRKADVHIMVLSRTDAIEFSYNISSYIIALLK